MCIVFFFLYEQIETSSYICGLQGKVVRFNRFPTAKEKNKNKKGIYQCDSPYPHHAVNIELMACLQGPLRTDKACSMKINLVRLRPCEDKVADGLGTETKKTKNTEALQTLGQLQWGPLQSTLQNPDHSPQRKAKILTNLSTITKNDVNPKTKWHCCN